MLLSMASEPPLAPFQCGADQWPRGSGCVGLGKHLSTEFKLCCPVLLPGANAAHPTTPAHPHYDATLTYVIGMQAQICDDFNAGAPCTTRAGFEGLCQPPVVIDSFKRDAYCADKVSGACRITWEALKSLLCLTYS